MDPFTVKVKDLLDSIIVVHHDKNSVPNYFYVDTLKSPKLTGHVFRRVDNGDYALALSKSDYVRVDGDGYLYAYHQQTIDGINRLWKSFVISQVVKNKRPETVPIKKSNFLARVEGVILSNIYTRKSYDCTGKSRDEICADLKISPYILRLILHEGQTKLGWVRNIGT